jgi:uncharacterized protein YybS (DUF2232 family)
MNFKGFGSILLLSVISMALALTTGILAPLPLLLLRRNGGRVSFLLGSIIALIGLYFLVSLPMTLFFLAAVIMSFIYSECENQNIGYSSSVFVSTLVVCGFTAIALGYGMQRYGFDHVGFFRTQVDAVAGQLNLPATMKIDRDSVVKQVPSGIIILVIFSIWLNSVLVRRFEGVLGWSPGHQKHVYLSRDFREWKLPDAFVWVALLSAAGTYFEFDPVWLHWVAANVFNVVVLLYFFQGLAVVVDFFTVKQVSPFWRAIAYMFIFLQLFLMVSFLGFVDLWAGFRNRKKTDKSAVA